VQVTLTAADANGNPIPTDSLKARWTSRTPGVATVQGSGTATIQGVATGRTVLDVRTGTATLRVHVAVRGLNMRLQDIGGSVLGIHGNGERTLATVSWSAGSTAVAQLRQGSWAQEPTVAPAGEWVRVTDSGEAWILGNAPSGGSSAVHGLYRSPAPGQWSLVTTPANPALLTTAGNTVFIAGSNGSIFRKDGESWTPITLPAAGDSTITLERLAAGGPGDLYVSGRVQKDGGWIPFLARWHGGSASRLALPPLSAGSGIVDLVAGGGRVYALATRSQLMEIAGSTVTRVAHPLNPDHHEIVGASVAPDGSLHLVTMTFLYLQYAGKVAILRGGTWEEWLYDWSRMAVRGLHVDASGRMWTFAMSRGLRQQTTSMMELEVIR
jgi:hypothetical protein